MVKVLFGSIVRNGKYYLPRYFDQIEDLRNLYSVDTLICEGDSKDNSYEYLKDRATYLFKHDHKGPNFGSVNNPTRWFNIASTWNYMLDNFKDYDNYDVFIYMEADLIWNSGTIKELIDGLGKFDAISPLSMHENRFYDTWGYRTTEGNLPANYLETADYKNSERYKPLISAGSCIAMKIEVIKNCRLSTKDAMIGHDIIRNGYSFVLDKTLAVYHP